MSANSSIEIIECPRDAMQGRTGFIPTEKKIEYLNALLDVGFSTLDCAAFVSPKAIPQMADSAQVIRGLKPITGRTKLLAIVANLRGAEEASEFEKISCLGFPFSVSETFQQLNANSSVDESLKRVEDIQNICLQKNKTLVVYMSMGFGNPYSDPFSAELLIARMKQIENLGVRIISVADTVGLASPELIQNIMGQVMPEFPALQVGVHLHSDAAQRNAKADAALAAGVRRFDAAVKGFGGCPMAGTGLVGNMDTEELIGHLQVSGFETAINAAALSAASALSAEVFRD